MRAAFACPSLAKRRRQIVVQGTGWEEKFLTLDGQERQLCLMTCAFVMPPGGRAGWCYGWARYSFFLDRSVFLESAVFIPQLFASRRLGLSSPSSYRFERGIDQQRSYVGAGPCLP